MSEKDKKLRQEHYTYTVIGTPISLQYINLLVNFLLFFNGCIVLKLKLWSDGFVLVVYTNIVCSL